MRGKTLKRDCAWLLQISVDGGKTWTSTGDTWAWQRKNMLHVLERARNESYGDEFMMYRLRKYKAAERGE